MDDVNSGTDAELVRRVRGGDVQAYGALVDRYERPLLAAVLPALRGDVHAARDVVQDVLVLCYVKLPTLRDPDRFGGWLLAVGGREAVRAAKRRRRTETLQVVSDEPETSDAGGDRHLLDDDDRRQLLECVARLPAHERLAVSLRYFEGRGVHEVARIIGRPVGTVTKQLSRAVERLRGQLQTSNTRTKSEKTPCHRQTSKTS